ncbi:MAG: hypothetical protein M1828_004676 [Chrysothrix sp. TS-e1954]|nr:MAG: hypothetical protein M1828_004676 [Chrysothrix sp. TS-e1954]
MNNSPPNSAGSLARPPISNLSDDDASNKTAVKVAVRVRPPVAANDPGFDLIPHRFRGSTCQVNNPTTLTIQSAQGKKLFVFDRVFADSENQEGVWDYVSDSVSSFVQGYNVSLLAYGQSGAGKSYTMGTSSPGEEIETTSMGIVPRAAASLFDKLNGPGTKATSSQLRQPKRYSALGQPAALSDSTERSWQMKATYVEIYNEQLRDLLVPETIPPHERGAVAIREDTKGRILLTGMTQVDINSIEDLLNALNFGSSIRQTDSTAINSKSSRSHAVLSINLIQKKNRGASPSDRPFSPTADHMNGTEHWVTTDSKLHFVDLAGSERLKNTGLTGERVKEGISINAGLASLGKVISQLSSRSAGSHVSYRDSRLTRLLQDSLGGNAITYMIACINPVEFHLSETLNTVQYAQRARAIQSKPQIQQRAEDGDKQLVIDRLRSEVAFLREQIRLSERTERRNTPPTDRNGRKNDRANELQNQLLDVQENYSALSQRHTKLISEIAKSRGEDPDSAPVLKGAANNAALERLNRSNNFAEAVEQVVLEYEKTIQSLETSLSNSRSSLSTSESSLLEREAKIVYMEAVTQQLQARVTKYMDREANSENYLRELESKLDGISSGEERHMIIIQDLRKELTRIRESESSAEEYISTLEERLAEAEQDTDIMQREIRRLEHVVERQRTVGKMDNLLNELDNIRHDEVTSNNSTTDSRREHTPSDMFHDRLVATTTNASHPNGDVSAHTAEEEWKSFGPMEGEEETTSQTSANGPPVPPKEGNKDQSSAQSRAIADKFETVTMELFDLRVDHESTVNELDDVSRKYQIALNTLADLQDAVDEAKIRPASSFLGGLEGTHEPREDGLRSSSRMRSSELSSHGESPTLAEASENGTAPSERGVASKPKDESLADHVRRLKRTNAEKDIDMAELTENYSQLQDQHKTTLDYIEELKDEVAKLQQQQKEEELRQKRPSMSLTNAQVLRRSTSSNGIGRDRESRAFNNLRSIAVDNLQGKPEAATTFESNISAAATEMNLRSERILALEAENTSIRKEMEVKNTMLSGLSRERSMRPSPTMDITLVTSMKEQLAESQKQIQALHESSRAREEERLVEMSQLKRSLANGPLSSDHVPGEFPDETSADNDVADSAEQASAGQSEAHQQQIANLQKEVGGWEAKHRSHMESTKEAEQQLMQKIEGLESSLSNAETLHAERFMGPTARKEAPNEPAVDYEVEKTKHLSQISTLQKEIDGYKSTADAHTQRLSHLEKSYHQILAEVDKEAQEKELTQSELQTHRNLVQNLEGQIEQQKNLAASHQQGLTSLQESHAKELDELKMTLAAQQEQADQRLTEQLSKHQESTSGLQGELTRAHMELAELMSSIATAMDAEPDSGELDKRVRSLADERKSLAEKHAAASSALESAQQEMQDAKQITIDLEQKIQELTKLNEETLSQLERSDVKEKKYSRLVQELEDQLNTSFDQHKVTNNRLSSAQKQREDVEKELDDYRSKANQLEAQLKEMKRNTAASSVNGADVNRNPSTASTLRKSPSHTQLPSPPPAVPLPPLPGNMNDVSNTPRSPGPGSTFFPQPPTSPTATSFSNTAAAAKDAQSQAQIEEQDARIRMIDKQLYAEKQLTLTLEEALVDLETQANKTKAEVEAWKKKCRELEDEAGGLRAQRGSMRNSLQAVEEERDKRIRAEAARRQLEERMESLTVQKKKGRKGGGLNCF